MSVNGKFLTKEQIFAADDIVFEAVECPEWGGSVILKSLTGKERDNYEASLVEQKKRRVTVKMENVRAKLLSKSIVDPDTHERLFSDSDIDALGNKSAAPLDRLFDVARRLSGLDDDDVEELTANFTEDQNDDSISDSP